MNKRFLIVVAAVIAVTNAFVYLTGEVATTPGHCSLKIARPEKGSVVDITEMATGSATIPGDAHLWLLVKLRADSRWWPQGEANVAVETWKLQVQFGVPQQKDAEFYLAAAAVSEKAHVRLAEWAGRKADDRRRPTSFPEIVAGCPLDVIAVRRSK